MTGNWTFCPFVSSPPSPIQRFLLIFLLIQLKPKHHHLDVLTIFQRGARAPWCGGSWHPTYDTCWLASNSYWPARMPRQPDYFQVSTVLRQVISFEGLKDLWTRPESADWDHLVIPNSQIFLILFMMLCPLASKEIKLVIKEFEHYWFKGHHLHFRQKSGTLVHSLLCQWWDYMFQPLEMHSMY